MKSNFFKNINENQESYIIDNENLIPKFYSPGSSYQTNQNKFNNNHKHLGRRFKKIHNSKFDFRYQASHSEFDTSTAPLNIINDVTTEYDHHGIKQGRDISGKDSIQPSSLYMSNKEDNVFDYNIPNNQLPFLLGNILDLKSQMKQLKSSPYDKQTRDVSTFKIPLSERTNSDDSLHARVVPDFNYPSEQSFKPYIENPETGHYYNMNLDYEDNNSDFFPERNRKITDFDDYSSTPSIGSPERSIQEQTGQRSLIIKYLKDRLRIRHLRNDSEYSLVSTASRRRRHRRQLRMYTHHMKKKIKHSFSHIRKR